MSSFSEEQKRFVFDAKHTRQTLLRSSCEVGITLVVYVFLLAALAYSNNLYLNILLIPLLSLTTIRVFILQHDCCHRALFSNDYLNKYIGNFCSIITLTPYLYWRDTHLYHHNHFGIKGDFEIGYMEMLTQEEYDQLSPFEKWKYRITRSPLLLLFIFGPLVFILLYRSPFLIKKLTKLPPTFNNSNFTPIYWQNFLIVALLSLSYFFFGPLFLGKLLISYIIVANLALILFYIQHNTENIYITDKEHWCRVESAIVGSSFFDIPVWLRWFAGNIQYHHIHHLNPKIPFYRLKQCHQRFLQLGIPINRVKISDIGYLLTLKLISEKDQKMVPFN